MQTRTPFIRSFALVLVLAVSATARAQQGEADGEGFEEIIVVGTESESAEDFAAADSVTGFGAEDLAALGAQDISDLAAFTPNLEIVTSGATTPTFFIRGVGLNDFNPNSTGAVAVFADDVAINAPALQLSTLFDIEGVNVLRGPQGTGLNRNASAGAIKVYSRKPSGDFGGFLTGDFGNFGYVDLQGAVEAPIYEDILATRMAFRFSQRDGTMLNRCANAPPVDERVPSTRPNFTAPPASHCGEFIPINSISQVPTGLEKYVSNTNNWAARANFLFQPTLDMSWIFNGHGSQRDEITRLGQSIGTNGSFCPVDDSFDDCINSRLGNPGISEGLLGGPQAGSGPNSTPNSGYIPREIEARYFELGAGCVFATTFQEICSRQSVEKQRQVNAAKVQIAQELADDLDSHPWEGDFDHTGPTTNDTWGLFLNGDVALPYGIQFKSTTGYDAYDRLIDIDLDFSPQTLFHIKTDDDGGQFYQALAFSGQIEQFASRHRSPLRWETGAYYLGEQLNVEVVNDFGTTANAQTGVLGRKYEQDMSSAGGFFKLAFDFVEDFTLDGGFRYNWEQKKLDMRIFGGALSTDALGCEVAAEGVFDCNLDESWSAPTGTVRLVYRFREDTQAFWSYARGWKPGTFNATASAASGPTAAQPETLDSFEAGLRGNWFSGRLGVDLSFFYYAYENYQIFTARQLLGGTPEFIILNANDAEVYGSELDARIRPWVNSFINIRFSWLESQFLDFLQRDQFSQQTSGTGEAQTVFRDRQASGNPLLNSPRFKVSMTGEQTAPLGRYGSLTLRYDGVWTDTNYYDSSRGRGLGDDQGDKFLPENTIAQREYWLHNLRLSWRSADGRTEVAGWVRNITNQEYKNFAFDGSNFQATTIYFVGDPRTIGATLSYNF